MSEPSEPVVTVLQKLALWPDGREFFDRGPLECVAVVFGVRPAIVEQVRALLRTAAGRARLAALESTAGPPQPPPEPVRRLAADRPTSAEELVERARGHELGVRCLIETPVETAAVLFGVTPFLVLEARRLLHAAGIDPEASPEGPSGG